MCGICGWVSCSGATIEPSVLKKMVSQLHHRGPDDRGYWYSDRTALGHTRLSIIDLNTGSQPMADQEGFVIVFNGEIYNYRAIRQKLVNLGAVFRTESDTEVILESYKAWGKDCVYQLDGMFAFAIADPRRKKLFLARDRLGKKPLHYFFQNGLFIFSSEIKAILQHEVVRSSVSIDDQSLVDYLSIGYVLSPKTIFRQIRRLPPASWAFVDWVEKKLEITRYWKLEDYYKAPKSVLSANQEKSEFLKIFSKAVESRLHADVPVGAFLSSGLDSASVVAIAKASGTAPLQSYSIGFKEGSYDESRDVRKTALELGTDLKVRYFENVSKSDISRILWHFDEPFSDNSAQPTFQLNRLASNFGKVALSGDGADELFAGYPTYRADQYFRFYEKLPRALQQAMLSNATKWLRPTYRKVSMDYRVRQFLGSAGFTPEEAHYWWRVIFPFSEVQKILSDEFLESIEGYQPFQNFLEYFQMVDGIPFLDQALYVDAQTWLLDDILVKVDRMSMAHSVEVRCPFLDQHLVEHAAQLPTKLKMGIRRNKIIVRDGMSKKIPNIVRRSRKQGFNSPPIKDVTWALPTDNRFQGNYALDPNKEDVTFKATNLLVLNVWFDMYNSYKKTGLWEPIKYDG
jgi:asparagine synthase (glutamine-hydrolysing)